MIAAQHALRRAEDDVASAPNDLNALAWDEACRAFSAALIDACASPRLIDMQRKFFDQSRRFRLALLREGHLDFTARKARQHGLVQAVLARDSDRAVELWRRDLEADLKPSKNSDQGRTS